MIARIIAGSYPSGPSAAAMPEIWRMIADDEIAAYNVPSGILFDMHREAAMRRPGVLTKVGLDTFVDPARDGCAMNDRARSSPIVRRESFDGDEWLFFPAIIPAVAIVRATTADSRGNLSYEHEGAFLGALEQAIAVRNHGGLVVAQVKRITAAGAIAPQQVHLPGHLVDLIVLAPEQRQTTRVDYDPAISGELRRPWDSFAAMPHGAEKIIARRAAMELCRGDVANLGFGVCAHVPEILLEENLADRVTWVIEQGATGGMPLSGFAFGCAANAEAIIPSPAQFMLFQGGGFDVAMLSFLEIDKSGAVNVSKLAKRPYLTAGCGGFVDITAGAKKIVFAGMFAAGADIAASPRGITVKREGKFAKLVDAVEHITFSGERALQKGQRAVYVTERGVLELTAAGLVLTEIAPGIDLRRDILERIPFPLKIADDLGPMEKSIFARDVMNLRLARKAPRR